MAGEKALGLGVRPDAPFFVERYIAFVGGGRMLRELRPWGFFCIYISPSPYLRIFRTRSRWLFFLSVSVRFSHDDKIVASSCQQLDLRNRVTTKHSLLCQLGEVAINLSTYIATISLNSACDGFLFLTFTSTPILSRSKPELLSKPF